MSIFKETLDEGIQTQLQARTLVVNGINNNRSGLLPWYLSKNAWVRMTSFVNYTDGIIKPDGSGSIIVDSTTGHYKGNQLSKKYILEGGTLYTTQSGDQTLSSLRYGVATANGVYGSNIDIRPDGTADSRYSRQQGLRPMPGITDVSMRTIGAYGSLFETTVNFHAWDSNQLNELELLFMRPGYSVLLEWGWSQYLNYNNTSSKNDLTELDIYSEKFLGQTINPFDPTLTPDIVYQKLEELRGKYRHNYDGMLGYVKNFNWKLRRDGGYDCSTTLISMGEVINTLKLSTNANTLNDRLPSDSDESSYYFDDYENVLLSLKAQAEKQRIEDGSSSFLEESFYSGSWEVNSNFVGIDSISTKLKNSKYNTEAEYVKGQPLIIAIENQSEEENSGEYYEYLSLDVVVAIISSYANLRSKNINNTTYPYVQILTPKNNDYCLAGKDTISVLPNVCVVANKKAFNNELKYFSFSNGFNPEKNGVLPDINQPSGASYQYKINFNFYDDKIKAGKIKDIYVNIDFLLNTYRGIKSSTNESGVNITDYLKKVLDGISNALGGLNNFTLSTAGKNQNTLRIIDTYYLEQGKTNDKYQFDLLGLGSICKDVSIQSQIFQEQSTIVAIAAQSKANLADVYNSTQVYLNAGLEDRLAVAKWQGDELETKNPPIINSNDGFYRKLARLMVYARKYLVGSKNRQLTNERMVATTDSSGNDPHTILKSTLLRYDGEINFKALIPFKLRITLEGIGGIVVGQIFTVKQNVLPKNYYDKKLGFIITQIEHVLKNNQWETVLDTQICILDQQNFYDENGLSLMTNQIVRKGFGNYVARTQLIAILYPILIDFLIYQSTKSIIGYVYASADRLDGIDFIKEYLIDNFNKNDVYDFWRDNVGKFIGETPRLTNSPLLYVNPNNKNIAYDINSFSFFLRDWIEVWKTQYANRLNTQFTPEGETLEDALNFISSYYSVNNVVTTTTIAGTFSFDAFSDYLGAIDSLLNTKITSSMFYPNTGENIFGGTDIKTVVNYTVSSSGEFRSGALVGVTTFEDIYGWNNNAITNNVETIIKNNGDSLIQTIIENYNNGTVVSGTPLKSLFQPNSPVMYGETNSLIIQDDVDVRGNALNSWGFASQNNKYKNRDQVWANLIYWESNDFISPQTSIRTAKTRTKDIILGIAPNSRPDDFWNGNKESTPRR